MIITLFSYKGGVSKSTSALHISGVLAAQNKKVLTIDGDQNRSLLDWDTRGQGLPFKVVDEKAAAKFSRDYEYIVIDTGARPEGRELKAMADTADRFILVTAVAPLSLAATIPAITDLKAIKAKFSVLLSIVPPGSKDAERYRETLESLDVHVLKTTIPQYAAFKHASLRGVLVDEISDANALIAAQKYEELTKEILNGK